MHHALSSSVAGLEQYAVRRWGVLAVSETERVIESGGDPAESSTLDEIAVLQLFQTRRELFTQVAALEEEILLRLPKSWWRYLNGAKRGPDLIWELDRRWQDRGHKADDPMRDVIRLLRQFLVEECHCEENELGTQLALQERG